MTICSNFQYYFVIPEAVVQRCSAKKVFLEISENSQTKNNCIRVSFLTKFQALICYELMQLYYIVWQVLPSSASIIIK